MLAEIHANELLAGLTAEHDRLADQLDSLKTRYEAHATTRLKRQIDDTARKPDRPGNVASTRRAP